MALFVPEIFSNSVLVPFRKNLIWGKLATDVTNDVFGIREYGETINFPKFTRTITAKTVTKGTAFVPDDVDMSNETAVVAHIAAGGKFYKRDALSTPGSFQDIVVSQIGTALAENFDINLAAEAIGNTTLAQATAAKENITASELINGIAKFGDQLKTNTFAGIVVNPKLYPTLVGMDEFTSTNLTYQTAGNGMMGENGLIGYFIGIPVYLTSIGTYDTVNSQCVTTILKKDALGFMFKEDITLNEDYNMNLFQYSFVADTIHAVHTMDDYGVCILKNS